MNDLFVKLNHDIKKEYEKANDVIETALTIITKLLVTLKEADYRIRTIEHKPHDRYCPLCIEIENTEHALNQLRNGFFKNGKN